MGIGEIVLLSLGESVFIFVFWEIWHLETFPTRSTVAVVKLFLMDNKRLFYEISLP